jgi:Rhodanese-related sulfurtransferase
MTAMFVSADWLNEHYHEERLQVLDARMLPPGQEAVRDITAEYLAGHLPDAPFFNIEALSDHTSPVSAYDAARRDLCRGDARAGHQPG